MQNLKLQFKIKNYLVLVFLLIVGFVLIPTLVLAAELYLKSSEDNYYINEIFVVDIRIDVENNESINAVEAYLKFPNNILEIKDFSTGNSILTFVEGPKINQEEGLISFGGIVPGGYSGRITGDPGKSNLLGKMIFQAISIGSAQVLFQNNSEALLNDGKGTPAKLTTKGVIIEAELPKEVQLHEPPKDEWQQGLKKDRIPPEDFSLEIVKINDKYYLVFITKDKDSGIDHYDVLEKSQALGLLTPIIVKWIEADSPYLLKDQLLNSSIEVRAVDKAGNERIVKLPTTYSSPWYKHYYLWCIIILAALGYVIRKLWPYRKIR